MNECLHSSLVAKLSKRSLVFLFQLQIFSAPYCPGRRPWHLKWYHQCIFSIKCILFSSLNIRTQSLIGNVSGWVSTFQSLSSLWWLSYILIIQEKKMQAGRMYTCAECLDFTHGPIESSYTLHGMYYHIHFTNEDTGLEVM